MLVIASPWRLADQGRSMRPMGGARDAKDSIPAPDALACCTVGSGRSAGNGWGVHVTLWVALWVFGTVIVAVLALNPAVFPALANEPGRLVTVGPLRPVSDRLRAAHDHLIDDLGRAGAAFVVYSTGLAVTGAICWLLGKLAGALLNAVDWPVFRSARAGQVDWLVEINKTLTLMGNRPEIKTVTIVAGVLLAIWYLRRWWVPVVALVVAFSVEFYLQGFLALTVHRGHPPTTLGTWPSGGCARLIASYGLIIWLYLRNRRHGGPRSAALLWGLLAVAAWLEGYSRVILLKHWATDVVGGWIFGALLLAAAAAALAALDPIGRRAGSSSVEPEAVGTRT